MHPGSPLRIPFLGHQRFLARGIFETANVADRRVPFAGRSIRGGHAADPD